MNDYPETVGQIVEDYLQRLKASLRPLPDSDKGEFLREISSHIYEAYQAESGTSEVARILAVLRKFGEPSEVVAERLPAAMVDAGRKRNLPLYVLGGILITLFGLPLGFGGVAVLIGMLAALLGLVVAYFATSASLSFVGLIIMGLGCVRIIDPLLWDNLVGRGFIHIEPRAAEFLDLISPSGQGFLLLLFGGILAAGGLALLRLGKYLLRGLSFVFSLLISAFRKLPQIVRRTAIQAEKVKARAAIVIV